MDAIKLTKRESEIMDILWENKEPMSATDVKKASDHISIYTIQQVLSKLLSMGMIQVSGIGKNKKTFTRLYAPILSQSEYIDLALNEKTKCEIAIMYIKNIEDLDVLDGFEKIIQTRKSELNVKKAS